LQFLARFESNGFTLRNGHLRAGARVAAYAALARLNYENAEPAKLNALTAFHSLFHSFKKSFNGDLGLHFRNAGFFRDVVNDVKFYHKSPCAENVYSILRLFVFYEDCKKAGRIIGTAFMGVKLANNKRDAVSV
jgi:hypothetical protein